LVGILVVVFFSAGQRAASAIANVGSGQG
jgi:hypothetical protein